MDISSAHQPPTARASYASTPLGQFAVADLQAARRVLAERGAEGTSIDAIACEAGVGKGTVFRRFGDRSGLFQALSDEHLRSFQDAFIAGPPPLGPGAPPDERLVAFLDGLLDLYDDHLELTLALEKDRWRAPIEGYLTLSMHLENLLQQVSPKLDAPDHRTTVAERTEREPRQLPASRAGRKPRRDQAGGSAADRGTHLMIAIPKVVAETKTSVTNNVSQASPPARCRDALSRRSSEPHLTPSYAPT